MTAAQLDKFNENAKSECNKAAKQFPNIDAKTIELGVKTRLLAAEVMQNRMAKLNRDLTDGEFKTILRECHNFWLKKLTSR